MAKVLAKCERFREESYRVSDVQNNIKGLKEELTFLKNGNGSEKEIEEVEIELNPSSGRSGVC